MRETSEDAPAASRAPDRARYSNGERRREQIIEAAVEIFAEQGYTATSLRAIAERAGTSHVSLKHHFGTKEAIFQRVLEHRFALDRVARQQSIPGAGILEIAGMMMRRNMESPELLQLDATLTAEAIAPEHPAHDYILRTQEDFVAEVAPTLAHEQKAGRIRAELDPTVVARQLNGLIQGIQVQWLYNRKLDMELHVRTFLELLRP
ncbi:MULTISPECIES: TetR/AcrR family transcriptional regulator [unclassified Rathayibacter]|uniref:TetR/AcrR family transcriptional regulator n=1 Tax=unclassified Rathayibacter TaxID=2609250 RepID=UPI0010E4E45B|nr:MULTISPECIES: TetR/AcrR family transcriptional regulator [unclassified Rathayibacter]TCL79466.1 TetR family transcriptional regulator [Rathayibacter sp. PhB192]TCM25265.1 TetR family transcriptional regulator [Rathayibacter sp. PhB179]